MTPPPPSVLAAFGAAGHEPEALAGGRGTAWRAGGIVLKPLDMTVEALRWQAGVLASVVPDGFRVAAPRRSVAGELVVGGWTAWPLLPGAHAERWADIVSAGERFHRALAGVDPPAGLLEGRTDRWARADRVAWGEADAGADAAVPEVARLLAARRPVEAASQLVHGDLSGNVLFADGLPPAIIDLSPYWRPAAYASAVILVDAVLWHGAGAELLATADDRLVVRALLFRLLAEQDPAAAGGGYSPAIRAVCG